MSLKYKWILPTITKKERQMMNNLAMPGYLAQVLISRGFNTKAKIYNFMHPSLSQLHNPFGMHDMKDGVQRLKRAIKNQTKITIYGDYDVDGMTSTSIMYSLLKTLGANVHYFIPNRFRDGYGPNLAEYKRIIKNGTKLLVTVDNGISGLKEITYAKKHGMHVIITDHHDFPQNLPPADDIIMAQYPGHKYNHGLEDFCGAGIAFKIATAMLGYIPTKLLDLACLGTVADSVSLTHEDRVIVAEGLKLIRHDQRPGIKALAKVADIDLSKLTSTELSFTLIPRLNALGRMTDANPAVELLTTRSQVRADQIAQKIEQCNNHRQDIMHSESKEALQQAAKPSNLKKCTLVLHNDKWFPGIVGIIASNVLEKYYKPTIVIGHLKSDDKKGIDRGSGRSIPEFNLFKAMDPLRKTMTSFGGHPMACGLSIKPNEIKALRNGLEKAGQQAKLGQVIPTVKPDLVLTADDITYQTIQQLSKLEPFGQDNASPLIALKLNCIYNIAQMGKTNNHLRFTLGESYRSVRVVAWRMGDLYKDLKCNPYNIEIAGSINLNHFRGHTYVQFQMKYIRHFAQRVNMNRKKIGLVYLYLHKLQKLNYNNYVSGILLPVSHTLNMTEEDIDTAIQVFVELGLATNNNGMLKMVKNPKQCKLTDSETYNYCC